MDERRIFQRYRACYGRLLQLYPRAFRERFGEGMAQTFHDLIRERYSTGRPLFIYTLRLFVETTSGMIQEQRRMILMQHKGIVWLAVVTALLLMIPLITMQVTQEVKWTLFDFVVAGGLIFGSGLIFQLIAKQARSRAYRAGLGIAVGGVLLLIWANLAVGIIGSENNPLNLMYFGVLAVGVLGAAFARLRSEGMARAAHGMAIAQMLIAMVALPLSQPSIGAGTYMLRSVEILMINACFAVLFVAAGWFFRRATQAAAS